MKKTIILLIFAVLFITSCSAQNVNIERLIVGNWTDNDGDKWVFNSNGTFTHTGINFSQNGRYTGSQLAFKNGYIMNISVSSDGKTIILSNIDSSRDGYFLVKD